MKRSRKLLYAGVASLALVAAVGSLPLKANANGIPTVDIAVLAQLVIQVEQMAETYKTELEQLGQLQQTYEVAVNELNTLKNQFDSITNVRDINGALRKVNKITSRIENSSMADMASSALGGDPVPASLQASLTRLNTTYDLSGLSDLAASDLPHDRGIAEQASASMVAVATAEAGYDRANRASERMDGLMEQVGQQEDLKAAVDFNTRMVAENNLLLVDLLRVLSAQSAQTGAESLSVSSVAAHSRRAGQGEIGSLEE